MTTDKLPPFLQDEAHSLRVTWRKSINYWNSFATLWFDLKRRFDRGEFDHRRDELKFGGSTFGAWAAEIGMPDEFVNKVLKVHELALADEHRQALYREEAQRKRQRREVAEQRAVERARREVRRDIDRQEREAEKARRDIERQEREAEKLREAAEKQREREEAKAAAAVAAARDKFKQKRAELADRLSHRGPINSDLQALLEASGALRQREPVDWLLLGHCYCDMRTLLERPEVRKGEGQD